MTIAPDLSAPEMPACACPEMRGLSRRGVLQGAGLAGLTYAVGSTVVSMSPAAAAGSSSSTGATRTCNGCSGYSESRPRTG